MADAQLRVKYSAMPDPTAVELLSFIKETFNWEELNTLCFQLYVPFDDLAGQTREAKARELIAYMQRVGRTPDLTAALARERPEKYGETFGRGPKPQPRSKPHTRNPRQIFISHAHQDTVFAHRLADDLRREKYEVWIAPESIPPGERWVEAINRGLRESGIFLLVSTPNAVDSEWVEDETNAAFDLAKKKLVRFIRLDVKEADVPPLWTVRQHVSFRGDYQTGLKLLLPALEPSGALVQPPIVDALPVDASTGQAEAQSPEISREVEPPKVETPKEEVSTAEIAASDLENSTELTSEQELEAEKKPTRTEPIATPPSTESKPKTRKRRKQADPKPTVSTKPTVMEVDAALEKDQRPSEKIVEALEQAPAEPADTMFDEKRTEVDELSAEHIDTIPLLYENPSTHTPELSTPNGEILTLSSTAIVGDTIEPVTEFSLEETPEPSSGQLDNAQPVDEINAVNSSIEPLYRSLDNPESTVLDPFQEPADISSEVDSANSIEFQLPPNRNRPNYKALAILLLLGGLGWLCSNTDFNYQGALNISTPETTSDIQEANVTSTREPQIRIVTLPGGLEVEQVYVPAGSLMMGSEDGNINARPVHEVTLDAFWIGRTEVTNAQYEACVSTGVCRPPSDDSSYTRNSYYGNPEYADYPVIHISWEDARTFSEWAGGQLPTEAQWEYAARGPESFKYPWGDTSSSCYLLNFKGNCVGDTSKTGSYLAGASWVDALDMAGNVWEWVNDWYDSDYYDRSPAINPPGPASGDYRVLRGGSWSSDDQLTHAAFRYSANPNSRDTIVGFRVVELLADPES